MKRFTILLLFISSLVFSQDKLLSVEDVVFKSYSNLYPRSYSQIQWVPNTTNFAYVNNDTLFIYDEENSLVQTLTFEAIKKAAERISAPVTYFPRLKFKNKSIFIFNLRNSKYQYNLEDGSLEEVYDFPDKLNNIEASPNEKLYAYTKENNLFIRNENGEETPITSESDKNIISGQTVHRNEFGISGGIFWSPNSKFLAFYKKNQTMVTDYPVLELENRPATVKNIKYPMAGDKSHHVKLGIYNIESGKTVFVKTGEPKDQYLTCVTWGPEEEFIYIALLNREQNHMKLVKYDASNGEQVKILFEEKDKQYVEPEHQLIFLPEDNDKFLWFSERDGWNHLYLYDTDGNMIKQVTKGNWEVKSLIKFDDECENIFLTATKDSPIDNNYYKVSLESAGIQRLTKESGSHRLLISDDCKYFIDSYSSNDVPRIVNLLDEDGNIVQNIQTIDNPLTEYKNGKIEIGKFTGDNKIDYYYRTFYPPNFDPNKKYPMIVYVYGGPHAQIVTNRWPVGRYDLWSIMMAQKGYIVFNMDNRGSAHRGLEFEQATHRQLGTLEVEDQLRGVDFMKQKGCIDENRIGVWGWSYGGFMTASLMMKANDTYKVGVAGGAVIDWQHYEVMYTERYMDTPQENPEGFKQSNLLNHVDKLKGKLLFVHGTSDDVVVWQHTLKFAKKAANLNVPLDYYPYIGHGHGVRGKDALHLYNKITEYFLNNL